MPRDVARTLSPLLRIASQGSTMKLYAPNIALFVIAWCVALLGVLAAFPIALPIPGLTGNSAWYIFLAWFLLAAGSIVPHQDAAAADSGGGIAYRARNARGD
jgi:hypothetical protein